MGPGRLRVCRLIGLAAMLPFCLRAELPQRIDDAAFRAMVVEFSEPDGSFADDNFVSNELGMQRLLPELAGSVAPGGVYLGVGPEQNFSYIAALRPRLAFIIDIRRQNLLEHLLYKALFEMAEDRSEFLSRLFSRPPPAYSSAESDPALANLLQAFRSQQPDRKLFEATLAAVLETLTITHGIALDEPDTATLIRVFEAFFADGPAIAYTFGETDDWHPSFIQLQELTDATGTNWSFLGSPERYAFVRDMQRDNRIVPVVGDFAGAVALRAIGDFLRDRQASVDVFYVSNVESYLFQDGIWEDFIRNVALLPLHGDSVFVRTFFGSTVRACPSQQVSPRVPLQAGIEDGLAAYRAGRIDSVCSLVSLSR